MINDTLRDADQKMNKAVEVAREEFAAIRAGRANPSMFAKLTADYYGTPTPIQQLASLHRPRGADHPGRSPTTWARWPPSRRRSASPTSA